MALVENHHDQSRAPPLSRTESLLGALFLHNVGRGRNADLGPPGLAD
jgi:hypothetical protein